MATSDDNPLKAALDLHAPEPSQPKPDEGALNTGLQLATNSILRFRNLFISVALLAAICVAGFAYIKDQSPILIGFTITIAILCVGIATWETTIIIRRRQREKMLRNWAILPLPNFRDDYFRVGPYDIGDHDRFRRSDGVDKNIIEWVRAAQTPLLYLSGLSGTGKSSLINASLIPAFGVGKARKSSASVRDCPRT